MLIMGDLQDMVENILNDSAGIGESSTFKTVSPQLKHSAPRPLPTTSLTKNVFSFAADQLVDTQS